MQEAYLLLNCKKESEAAIKWLKAREAYLLHERHGEHGAATTGSVLLGALTPCFVSSSAFLQSQGAALVHGAVCNLCSCHLCLQQQQLTAPCCEEEEEDDDEGAAWSKSSTIYGVQQFQAPARWRDAPCGCLLKRFIILISFVD